MINIREELDIMEDEGQLIITLSRSQLEEIADRIEELEEDLIISRQRKLELIRHNRKLEHKLSELTNETVLVRGVSVPIEDFPK